MIPRTRSSRFFLFLLHLVATNSGPNPPLLLQWNATGIQSVSPSSILLEISQEIDEAMPHWIQDAADQKCLGPMGRWGECGEATLWRIIPSSRRHARRRQWIRWATEDEDVDHKLVEYSKTYALQLVDDSDSTLVGKNILSSSSYQLEATFLEKECLSRRRKDRKIVVVPCKQDRAWFWKFENGIMHFDKPVRGIRSESRKNGPKKRLLNKKTTLDCVWRNASEAVLHPCDLQNPAQHESSNKEMDKYPSYSVQIQFARPAYVKDAPNLESEPINTPTARNKLGKQRKPLNPTERKIMTNESFVQDHIGGFPSLREGQDNVPSQMDIAHIHAHASVNHTEMRSASRMTSILPHQSPEAVAKELPRFLGRSNPILLFSDRRKRSSEQETSNNKRTIRKEEQQPKPLRREISSPPEKPMVRKIQVNPYILASRDELWTDPQTGLVYHTDLCCYLGHERKDAGRHTLTGVGQYTKTMLQIKVYGIGFYVSKRDILADPIFEAFASLTADELRGSSQFYEILRKMDGFNGSNNSAGRFDRTLFLKTNMQLSTETMRSSLDADWKMLTPEAKELLIGSSMKSRPATEETLKIIESPDNPSRCSCAQIAPKEYNADPTCCARGTELVFTWRKNGSLEIRLNGNFMDSFPRPDIAEGIFYEYLRIDNPMSVDFLFNAVEGFPFLLAPLSQVKGVSSPVVLQHSLQEESRNTANPFYQTVGSVGAALTSQVAGLAEFLHSGAHDLSCSAIDTAKSMGSAAKSLSEELERKRELIGKHVSAFSNRALSNFYSTEGKKLAVTLDWISDPVLSRISVEVNGLDRKKKDMKKMSWVSRFIRWAFGFHASSLSAADVTQRLLFSLVHLYLLLMLIATFPAQWTTQTKLVLTKRPPNPSSEPENSDSDNSVDTTTPHEDSPIKKRLFIL
ncbi:hypothetical protein IV203_021005 [Nitzschia inconspicua]|uniref:Uncharacterized protein n=1 Tax=Nitzschia inconspicua TaxID=303405 RepID=A0A9K3PDJ7_9STRA|nr:hypothetical protein IV203_021005 [Nitzschia inconspicua]